MVDVPAPPEVKDEPTPAAQPAEDELPEDDEEGGDIADDIMSKIRQNTNAEPQSAYNILQCVEWVRDALWQLAGYKEDMLDEDQRMTVVAFLTNPNTKRLLAWVDADGNLRVCDYVPLAVLTRWHRCQSSDAVFRCRRMSRSLMALTRKSCFSCVTQTSAWLPRTLTQPCTTAP